MVNKLIVGLGNPGKKYELTRHNVAWTVFKHFDFYVRLVWREKFQGIYAEYSQGETKYIFLKPLTYMNLSGSSVQSCMRFFKIPLEEVLVVHDEVDLPYGISAFKKGGGLAGHNGLKSIAEQTGGREFLRLRVGVGRSENKTLSDHVLSVFSTEEMKSIDGYLEKIAQAIVFYMENGYEKAASKYSRQNLIGE